VDEYFRKRFRTLDFQDALTILKPIGEHKANKLSMFDDKFWIWETLEEAIRLEVNTLTQE